MQTSVSKIRSSLLLAAVVLAVFCAQAYYFHIFTRGSYFIGAGDDAFYYYKIAQNIAGGHGPTFDGEHMTNGYHPLWMGFAVATFYLLPGHAIAPILILMSISSFSLVATLILLWRFLRQ